MQERNSLVFFGYAVPWYRRYAFSVVGLGNNQTLWLKKIFDDMVRPFGLCLKIHFFQQSLVVQLTRGCGNGKRNHD